MIKLGYLIICNNPVFLEKNLQLVNNSKLFDYVTVVIDSDDEKTFRPFSSMCDQLLFKRNNPKNMALPETVVRKVIDSIPTDWLLRLDDDEFVDQEFIEKVKPYLTTSTDDVYWLPRKWLWPDEQHYIINPMWYPDYQLRLFRNKCRVSMDGRSVHDTTLILGKTSHLPFHMFHYNLVWKTYDEKLERAKQYCRMMNISLHEFMKGLGKFYFPEDSKERIEVATL